MVEIRKRLDLQLRSLKLLSNPNPASSEPKPVYLPARFFRCIKNQLFEKLDLWKTDKSVKILYNQLQKDNIGISFKAAFRNTFIDYAFASYPNSNVVVKQEPKMMLAILREAVSEKPELKDALNQLITDIHKLIKLKSNVLKAQSLLQKEKSANDAILDNNIIIEITKIKEQLKNISEQLGSSPKSTNRIA